MRTVRSVARARNQPRGHLALIVVAVLTLLIVLMARADAQPADDDELTDGYSRDLPRDLDEHAGDAAPRARLYVPITTAVVERIITVAPPVSAVVEAAYRAGGLADDPTGSWRRRSRAAALIPTLSVRGGQNEAWRDVIDPTVSHSVVFDVRASWHLERLLFDPSELRITTLEVARRRERRRLATLAVRVYFDWVAARAAADRDPRAVLDAHEKTAELDALTAGWFSETLAKRAELR